MADYPLVDEKGEVFLNDGQLARHIRDKCGDTVGLFIEKMMEGRETYEAAHKTALALHERMCGLIDEMSQMEESLDGAATLTEKMLGL